MAQNFFRGAVSVSGFRPTETGLKPGLKPVWNRRLKPALKPGLKPDAETDCWNRRLQPEAETRGWNQKLNEISLGRLTDNEVASHSLKDNVILQAHENYSLKFKIFME